MAQTPLEYKIDYHDIPKEKPMENIPEDFEDKIEQAYYYFKEKVSLKGGMERDYFKQTLRYYFNENQIENDDCAKSTDCVVENNRSKEIFESEEEFDKFYDDNEHLFDAEKDIVKDIFKDKNYIRKPPVEKAEELMETIENITNSGDAYQLGTHDYCILSEGFQYLKAENERLKK